MKIEDPHSLMSSRQGRLATSERPMTFHIIRYEPVLGNGIFILIISFQCIDSIHQWQPSNDLLSFIATPASRRGANNWSLLVTEKCYAKANSAELHHGYYGKFQMRNRFFFFQNRQQCSSSFHPSLPDALQICSHKEGEVSCFSAWMLTSHYELKKILALHALLLPSFRILSINI